MESLSKLDIGLLIILGYLVFSLLREFAKIKLVVFFLKLIEEGKLSPENISKSLTKS